MSQFYPHSNSPAISRGNGYYCPLKKSCPHLGGESADKVLHQRNYFRDRNKQLEGLFGLAQNEITKLREHNTELQGENQRLQEDLSKSQHTIKKIFPKRKPATTGERKRGAPKGHPGTSRKNPASIDEYVLVPLTKCPTCNSIDISLCKNFDTHTQEDIIFKIITKCFIHLHYWCPHCKKIVYTFGDGEIPNVHIGPVARAIAAYLRYQIKISYDDVQRIFQVFGLKLSPAAFVGFDNKIFQKGLPLYETIKKMLPYSDSVNVDETGWKGDWLWAFITAQVAFYHVDEHRSGDVIEEHLGKDYKGILGSDFYSAYNSIKAFAKQKCNAHLLRDINDLDETFPENVIVLSFCQDLKKLIQDAILLHSQFSKLKGSEEWDIRKKDIFSRFKDIWQNPIPHPKTETLRKRLFKHKDEIFTFLIHPEKIAPTNNISEQSLRNLVLFRKITFGNRSDQGKKNVSFMATILQTAKRKGLNPIEILQILLTKGFGPEIIQKFGLPQPRAP